MKKLQSIKRAEKREVRRFYAQRSHPTISERTLQKIREAETPKEQRVAAKAEPVSDNILTFVSQEARMARQMPDEQPPDNEAVEMRKTGTDDEYYDDEELLRRAEARLERTRKMEAEREAELDAQIERAEKNAAKRQAWYENWQRDAHFEKYGCYPEDLE